MFLPLLVLLPAFCMSEDEVAEVRSLHIISDIRSRFARTLITSRVVNPSDNHADMAFHVTLPNSAFITDFRMYSSNLNRIFFGAIEERESAQKRFQTAKIRNETAGLIGMKDPMDEKETNVFKVLVWIRPTDKITFNLTYEEVLERRQGLYHHDIYIDPGQPVPDMKVDVAIQESRDITTLKTPMESLNMITDVDITGDNQLPVVQRPNTRSAYIRFHPTLEQQLSRWSEGIAGRFSVQYDVSRGLDSGEVLLSNGYFIHFFAPAVTKPLSKDVLFILDTSTSMFGSKLTQLKVAMKVILEDLNPDDRFNIITFGSRVVFWQEDMASVKQETTVPRAIEYLADIKAKGWTNVRKAIEKGASYMAKNSRTLESSLIIFLTDGQATAGETSPDVILQHIRTANTKDVPIYTLAFGKDADWELVKKLAIQNFGIGKRIYTDGSAAQQIENFYTQVANSMLHGVSFRYSQNVTKSTETNFLNYVEGSELIVSGQFTNGLQLDTFSSNVIVASASSNLYLKPATKVVNLETEFQNLTSVFEYNLEKMMRRVWAHLYIKKLLKERVGATEKDVKERLYQEALRLSLEHKLVTSVTSMIVQFDNEKTLGDYNEDDDLYYLKKEVAPTVPPPPRRRYSGGGGGGGWSRGGGGGDPHFMVYMKGVKYPLCFDVNGEDQKIYQFIHDSRTGLTVNVRMGQGKKHRHDGHFRMYMVEFAVMLHDIQFFVTRSNISIRGKNYTWQANQTESIPGARFVITKESSRLSRLSIMFDGRMQIDITNHKHNSSNPLGGDYLNIELGNEELMSEETDGILGQFINKKVSLNRITYHNGHLLGHLRARMGLVVRHGRARIVHRRDPIWRTQVSCWMLRKKGRRLFDAPAEYYTVDDMFQTTLS